MVWQVLVQVIGMALVMAALLFWPAGTLRYWQAWLFSGVFFTLTLLIAGYFLARNPAFLTRRMQWREPERRQQLAHGLLVLLFAAGLVVAGLDHRYGWSRVPVALVLLGNVAIIAGFLVIFSVFRANPYAANTVEVEAEQPVIATGPYALVRHPMYLGALPVIVGIPLALGSYWALLAYLPFLPGLVLRLLDEERVLRRDLPGYVAYTRQVRWRLLPGIW